MPARRPSFPFRLVFALGTAAALLAACRDDRPSAAGQTSATAYFPLTVGGHPVRAQLAVLPVEMSVGLMYRQSLGDDDGMLFVYREPQPFEFWMHNTLVPLDVGYFDAQGVLREIHAMQPNDDRPVPSRDPELKFALEVNQGWFRRTGVKTGDRLDLAPVAAALRARGFPPRDFALE